MCGAAGAETRLALVVTNQSYTQAGAALSNTHRDGDLVKAALERVGFEVWVVRDTRNEAALLGAIGEHIERLAEAGPDAVGFIYYSGHGAADRPDGANYLIPTEAPITHAAQLSLMAVRLDKVTETLARVGKINFVVFDACRNVPLQRSQKDLTFKGWVPVREQSGLLVAYATDPGNVAVDQSIYAKALAEEIVQPGREASSVFRAVGRRVRAETRNQQSPDYRDARHFDFEFLAAPSPPTAPVAVQVPAAPQTPAACDGIKTKIAGSSARCLKSKDTFQECFTSAGKRVCGPIMVVIPPGRFLMGSTDAEIAALTKEYPSRKDRWKWEGPERPVTIARPFAVGVTPVTRGEFAAFVAATEHKTDGGCLAYDDTDWKGNPEASWRAPGFEQDDSHPVVCVSWNDSQAYVAWLKKRTGSEYRLLSEAETEYVARGTTAIDRQPRYFFGDDPKDLCKYGNGADLTAKAKFFGWIGVAECKDGFVYTAPAGHFEANAFGVKDVYGNAWSWTEDCWDDNYRRGLGNGGARKTGCTDESRRVVRGGSWNYTPDVLRSAYRYGDFAHGRFGNVGLRVGRTLNPAP